MCKEVTYEEAKTYKKKLEDKNNVDSNRLQKFEKNDIGLVPDHIKNSLEFQTAKIEFDKSFSELKNFNTWFIKTFKKEYTEERKNKYKRK
jgi:hypothetical protein